TMRLTRQELEETLRVLHTLLVPAHLTLVVNGETVPHRSPLRSFPTRLPTRLLEGDELVTRSRYTTVEVYAVAVGEVPTLYELGIPVVETDIGFHVSVNQKVLLNKDRDNVTPAYLRALRVLVLNHGADLLDVENASEDWVREAAGDERASE